MAARTKLSDDGKTSVPSSEARGSEQNVNDSSSGPPRHMSSDQAVAADGNAGRISLPARTDAIAHRSGVRSVLASMSGTIVAHPEGMGNMLKLSDGASLRGTMFNVANTVLGAGILGLPYCAQQTGIVIACLMLIGVALLQDLSAWMLLVSVDVTKEVSYAVVAETLYNKGLGILVDAMVMLGNFGALTAYVVILGDLFPAFMKHVNAPQILANRVSLILIVTGVILMPLSSLRKMGLLRFASMFTLLVIGIFVVVIACLGFNWIPMNHRGEEPAPLTGPVLNLAMELPTILFAYNCNMNIPILYGELRRQSREEVDSRFKSKRSKMMASIHVALSICVGFYCLAATTGCLAFRETTNTNVFINLDPDNFGAAPFLKLAYAVGLACSFPVMCFSLVLSFHRIIWHLGIVGGSSAREQSPDQEGAAPERAPRTSEPFVHSSASEPLWGSRAVEEEWAPSEHAMEDASPPEPSCLVRQIEVIFLVGLAVTVGLLFPDLGAVFNLTGGVCGSFISFVFPGMFFYRADTSTLGRAMGATVFTFGVIVAIATPILLTQSPSS